MRREGSKFLRSSHSRLVAPAASLILASLLVIFLVVRGYSGTTNSTPLQELPLSNSIPSRSDQSIADVQPDRQISSQLPKQHVTPLLAPKLQPKVLASFVSGPAEPLPPRSPEEASFVDGYQRIRPVITAASYAPQTYKATGGIILPAGKAWRLGSAYVAIQYLRDTLQCTLPVQIWHTAGEIDDVSKQYFEVADIDIALHLTRHDVPLPHLRSNGALLVF